MNKEKRLLILSFIVIIGVSFFVYYDITKPTPTWIKTYGSSDNETGYMVINAIKNGYIALGSREISSDTEVYLMDLNTLGVTSRQNTFGGNGNDYGYSLRRALSGGYILIGKTNSYGLGNYDAWFVKVNEDMKPAYNVTYGGAGNDAVYSFKETKDSRYILAGNTTSFGSGSSDVYLLKVDPNGQMQWQQVFGGSGEEWGKSVLQSQNANYWILGSTNSYGSGGYDFYLVETNPEGSLIMNKTFGGIGDDYGDSIVENVDGSFLLTGSTNSIGSGQFDALIIKTDQFGNEIWNKTFGGEKDDIVTFSRETADHGYLIIGNTNSFGSGKIDMFVMKTDRSGNIEWNKTFGGYGDDYASFILETADNGYLLIGTTTSTANGFKSIILVKMDSNGTVSL
ncbi:MAG: hypothetical protein HVN35_03185 [Methanobacteriaceae archaeon]|nr:hypothetical protein [Methanobacteriaceae archaeon]